MNKREQKKFERALAKLTAQIGVDAGQILEEVNLDSLVTEEDEMYAGQAAINFFLYRIQPRLEKGEAQEDFDKRYHDWRIRVCKKCKNEFAYSYAYDGVSYCSLYCLDSALQDIGLQVTRGRDIRKRWGVQYHPAVVSADALQTLKQVYGIDVQDSFAGQS